MVIDMLCSNGSNETPVWQRLFWAICVGVVAGALTLVGGLEALQTMTIVSALPFSIVLLIACYGLGKALQIESAKRDSLALAPSVTNSNGDKGAWQDRLENLLSTPNKKNADAFIGTTVKKAFNDVKTAARSQ